MPKFQFQARSKTGQTQTGTMEALNEFDAVQKLKAQKLVPLRLVVSNKASNLEKKSFFGPKVPSKDMQIFTRQFSTLINAGIPVSDALKILSEGKRHELLKEAAARVRTSIEAGKSLGDSMALLPVVFDEFYVNMVRAGEEAGILDGILGRLAVYLEKSERIKKQVKGALAYPISVLFVAGLVVVGILVFIIPKFQDLYKQSKRALPAITQLVVNLSDFLIHRWYFAIGIALGIPMLFKMWADTKEGKIMLDRILIQSPIIGDLIQKASVAKFTRTLSTLLTAGVGIIEALEIAAKTAGNVVIENAINQSKNSVIQGKPLAAPLLKEKAIPEMVTQMIMIGEESGQLDAMLGKVADFYEEDVENAVKAMTSMIEPLMMIVLGGSVGFLVLAMYAPIFDMANNA